jgi:hypothetical protein
MVTSREPVTTEVVITSRIGMVVLLDTLRRHGGSRARRAAGEEDRCQASPVPAMARRSVSESGHRRWLTGTTGESQQRIAEAARPNLGRSAV